MSGWAKRCIPSGRVERALDVIRDLTARGVFLCTCNTIVYAAAPEWEDLGEIEGLLSRFGLEMVSLLPLGYPWEPRPLRLAVEIAEARANPAVRFPYSETRVSSYRPAEPPRGES